MLSTERSDGDQSMARKRVPKKRVGAGHSGSLMRIVGGKYRGRQIEYDGDARTRPMKDRTREAIFNLLGPAVKSTQVWDLFGGTGAMALEALSRGAHVATIVERRFPAARMIHENVARLELAEAVTVVTADTFSWWSSAPRPGDRPWVTFCCPPYALYAEREAELLTLVESLLSDAPPSSFTVLEFDKRFDAAKLPKHGEWDVRTYPPATVAIFDGGP